MDTIKKSRIHCTTHYSPSLLCFFSLLLNTSVSQSRGSGGDRGPVDLAPPQKVLSRPKEHELLTFVAAFYTLFLRENFLSRLNIKENRLVLV